MEITFVSSLTADDERRFATALLRMATSLLNLFPISYSIRIATQSGQVFIRTHSPTANTLQALNGAAAAHTREAPVPTPRRDNPDAGR